MSKARIYKTNIMYNINLELEKKLNTNNIRLRAKNEK